VVERGRRSRGPVPAPLGAEPRVVPRRQDRVLPEASLAALRLALGDADVRTVEGTHSWLITDPDAFTEILTNVLDARPPRGPVEGTPPTGGPPETDVPTP
jgi:hypothetical protein